MIELKGKGVGVERIMIGKEAMYLGYKSGYCEIVLLESGFEIPTYGCDGSKDGIIKLDHEIGELAEELRLLQRLQSGNSYTYEDKNCITYDIENGYYNFHISMEDTGEYFFCYDKDGSGRAGAVKSFDTAIDVILGTGATGATVW